MENRFTLREEYRPIVGSCRQLVARALPQFTGLMFEKLDDALYELSDKADTNHVQTSYFDSMREVRRAREAIDKGFSSAILSGYDDFWNDGPKAAESDIAETEQDSENLALMEDTDLEEGLAVNNMISRGENRYYRDLFALDQRLSHIAGGVKVDRNNNPLAPAAICNIFYQATRNLSLNIKVSLIIYKTFEHAVVDNLGGLYEQLNRQLVDAGILPKLSRKVRRSKTFIGPSSMTAQQNAAQTSGMDYSDEEEVADLQAELFSTLQQLLMRRRSPMSPALAVQQASLPAVETADLMSALSVMQQGSMLSLSGTGAQQLPVIDMRADLRRAMKIGEGEDADKRIDQNDEDAIDVISMLFEFILEDRNLPDPMKALLARLQIPMLKVAILDKTFFSRKKHPARRLLNNLAKAAVGWTESNGREKGGVYEKIESIVERILTGFDSEVDIFVELNAEFGAYLEHETRGSRIAEERVAQVTIGKEQLQAARHEVFEQINDRLLGRDDIPQVVVTLVREGWKDVMLLTGLRQGMDSEEWRQALEAMDQLLWSVEAKPDPDQRQSLLQRIPELLKKLRTGLNGISYDQHKMAQLFKELQACHVAVLKGGGCRGASEGKAARQKTEQAADGKQPAATAEQQTAPESAVAGKAEAAATDTGAAVLSDRYLIAAKQLPIGTWLEVNDGDEGKYRAKLSWRSKVSGNCLFVNRKGMKVAELSQEELAFWFRSEQAVILNDAGVPLMDRALKAMMQVLKNKG